MTTETMVEFRLNGSYGGPDGQPGETVLMRVSQMLCLFPDHQQIRAVSGLAWVINVFPEDWPKVEKAFRSAYWGLLGQS